MAGKYPIDCYGFKFTRSDELYEWVDGLIEKRSLAPNETLALDYIYDNGLMSHFEYKILKNRPIRSASQEQPK